MLFLRLKKPSWIEEFHHWIGLGFEPLRLPIDYVVAVDPVLAILALFLVDARLSFLTLLATVAQLSLLS